MYSNYDNTANINVYENEKVVKHPKNTNIITKPINFNDN